MSLGHQISYLKPKIKFFQAGGILCLLVIFTSGCRMPLWSKKTPLDLSRVQEGDIVLTFSGAVEAWGMALATQGDLTRFERPYTHAEAVFRDGNGRLMLGGVSEGCIRSRTLLRALPEFQHLALYRSKQKPDQRQNVAALLAEWVKDPTIRAAVFDYTLQDVPGRRDAFCCVGFLNEVYRHAGMPAPFVQTPWSPNAAGRHLGELLGFEFSTIITVDSIAQNPGYEQVLEWRNEYADAEQNTLHEKIARQSLVWYEAGWRLKTSRQFHVGLALARVPQSVKEIERTQVQLRLFAKDVRKTWARFQRRGKLEGLDDAAREDIRQAIFAKYRDRYFYRHEHPLYRVELQDATPGASP